MLESGLQVCGRVKTYIVSASAILVLRGLYPLDPVDVIRGENYLKLKTVIILLFFLKKYHLKMFKHLSKILFRNIVLFGINGCEELIRSTKVLDS